MKVDDAKDCHCTVSLSCYFYLADPVRTFRKFVTSVIREGVELFREDGKKYR
jgi:hypothetical protein